MILDEVHHAGDALSWGEAVREAFEPGDPAAGADRHAVPLRRQPDPVRHLRARRRRGAAHRVADFTYGYAHALADHVVRPVLFMAYSGEMQWRTRAGDEIAARLGEPLTKDLTAQALRTALDPSGVVDPGGAGGRGQAALRGTPARARRRRPGDRHRPGLRPRVRRAAARRSPARRRPSCCPTRRRASKKIADVHRRRASAGWSRSGWCPRASTCRGSPSASTRPPPRPRCSSPRRSAGSCGPGGRGETASVFLPSVPVLLGFAAELEAAARPRARQAAPSRTRRGTTSCSPQAQRHGGRAGRGRGQAFTALGARGRAATG